jgi:hypothetical protein
MVVHVTPEEMQTGQTGSGAQRPALVYEALACGPQGAKGTGRTVDARGQKARHFRTGANFLNPLVAGTGFERVSFGLRGAF